MSTRCSIAYKDGVHIYACCNSDYEVFLCDSIADRPREGYNEDIRIGHATLRSLYEQLKEYFEKEPGAVYERYNREQTRTEDKP